MLCYRTLVESSDYLSLTRDRKFITVLLSLGRYKWWKEKMVTEQGYGLGIGGCKRFCPADNGHSLVTLFSLSMSVKDRPLHWTLGKS